MHIRFISVICLLLFKQCTSVDTNNDTATDKAVGLWLVEKVQLGDQMMTPQARWTELRSDGTYYSGNGWLRNDQGSYEIDAANQTIDPTSDGMPKEFGAFTYALTDSSMYWQRLEYGDSVHVYWSRITELPKGPMDQLVGFWEETISSDTISRKEQIFFRWDRVFIHSGTPYGTLSGVWHIHAHRPELRLLYNGDSIREERWGYQMQGDSLVLHSQDASRSLLRINP